MIALSLYLVGISPFSKELRNPKVTVLAFQYHCHPEMGVFMVLPEPWCWASNLCLSFFIRIILGSGAICLLFRGT